MIPVTQSRTGSDGRCFAACLASILEVPESTVPEWVHEDTADKWLAGLGLRYAETSTLIPPTGYHLIEGISPRGGMHAVVGKNGKMVWDPHPQDGTGRGLVRTDKYAVLLPVGVDDTLRPVRVNDAYNTPVTKTFTITCGEDFMIRFEQFLAFVTWLGGVGHSCWAGLSVDGDGADRMKVAEKLPKIKELNVKTKGVYPDQFEYIGE